MATKSKSVPKDLYAEDFYAGSHDQAALPRERRFDELDPANLIEEVEDLGGARERSVRSRGRTIIEHLLELQYSPAQDPRLGWHGTIRTQRSELLNDVTPSLHRHLADHLPEVYARARHDAEGVVPRPRRAKRCRRTAQDLPYTRDQITGDWLP